MSIRKVVVIFGLSVLFIAGMVFASSTTAPMTISVSPNAVCSVLLDAKNSAPKVQASVEIEDVTSGGPETALKSYFVQRALLVPNSKSENSSSVWVAFLNKDGCAKAKSDPTYLGTGGKGFGFLSDKMRLRVLRVNGQCLDVKRNPFSCVVPFGDSRAVKGAVPYFPFQFEGRKDLNF